MRFFSLLLPTITTQYIYIYNSIGICLSIDENNFVLSLHPQTHTHTHTHIYYNTVSFHSIFHSSYNYPIATG